MPNAVTFVGKNTPRESLAVGAEILIPGFALYSLVVFGATSIEETLDTLELPATLAKAAL